MNPRVYDLCMATGLVSIVAGAAVLAGPAWAAIVGGAGLIALTALAAWLAGRGKG